jgi:ABC-2 type transport system ATP-binding protein
MSGNLHDEPAIELLGLTKRFGKKTAVDRLQLTVPRGGVFGLLGSNGAGKSTTLKMLMGMLSITEGEARVLGEDVASRWLTVRQRVGYVPETHHIHRWMRVGEAIGFCRAQFAAWNDQTCRELLELFKLDPARKVKHLSRGMLVKLSLLLAVSHDPEVLLLDEPLSGLDPIAREECLDGVLRTICQRGQTVVVSSHMLDDVRRLADTVGILHEGRLLVHGRVDELLATTKRIRVTLRDGVRPAPVPEDTVYQRLTGREWLLTVRDFTAEKVELVRRLEGAEHVEVLDIGLEDYFKDVVKGQVVKEQIVKEQIVKEQGAAT